MSVNSFVFTPGPATYFIYIVTNNNRTHLETGVTGDLKGRIYKLAHGLHEPSANGNCYYLIYWESLENVHDALRRERELNGFSLKKKKHIIDAMNPGWRFLNDDLHQIV